MPETRENSRPADQRNRRAPSRLKRAYCAYDSIETFSLLVQDRRIELQSEQTLKTKPSHPSIEAGLHVKKAPRHT
jgi:hypothetical protein